jgi:uncharacterized protein YndB with AHSA1/START domain
MSSRSRRFDSGPAGYRSFVALRNVVVKAPPEEVWSVLADGRSYSEWVVGTQEIVEVDPEWPRPGNSIHFRAGAGPLSLRDHTVSRVCEPPHLLQLEAYAHPIGSVRISIEVVSWGSDSLVILDEHPLRGPGLLLENPLVEGILTLRNRRMVRLLARLVEERSRSRSNPASR